MTKNIDYFADLSENVRLALKEDLGSAGDLTAELIDPQVQATATVIAKEPAIVCGRPWFDAVFQQLDNQIQIQWHCQEGESIHPNHCLCTLQGNARALLSGERSALNFLQTLSGTATTTAHYVQTLKKVNSHTQLLDTRKTVPGLRLAQKYAVHCGGGQNHRIGLYDAILIKENHIMAAGGIQQAVIQAKKLHPEVPVEVETESINEVAQALAAQADIIMLDNFTLTDIQQAVMTVKGRAKLEVSGNVEIDRLAALAATGVDFISTGALTKHLHAIDYSMRFQMES